jgi:TPR repeat protein
MALIKCNECGKEISSNAVNCPGCGNPLTQSSPATPVIEPGQFLPGSTFWERFWGKDMKYASALILVGLCIFIFAPTKEERTNKNKKNEKVAEKEIKQSDTYNEAAKKLAEIEAKIKLEEAFIANLEKDYKKAYKLLSPLAEQGNGKAQFRLGVMYKEGQGVPQDYEEAVKWFRLAAEQENHEAQLALALSLKDGKGVTKDREEAWKFMTLAADGGEPLAQYYLGILLHLKGLDKANGVEDYENSHMVKADPDVKRIEGDRPEKEYYISAHKWVNLSISNLNAKTQLAQINEAKELRSKLEKGLQPMEIKEAQRLAKEWMKNHSK